MMKNDKRKQDGDDEKLRYKKSAQQITIKGSK